MTIEIRVNGAPQRTEAATIAGLLAAIGVDREERGAAVAVNGAVVPRRDWDGRRLAAGDEVEIVRPYAGG